MKVGRQSGRREERSAIGVELDRSVRAGRGSQASIKGSWLDKISLPLRSQSTITYQRGSILAQQSSLINDEGYRYFQMLCYSTFVHCSTVRSQMIRIRHHKIPQRRRLVGQRAKSGRRPVSVSGFESAKTRERERSQATFSYFVFKITLQNKYLCLQAVLRHCSGKAPSYL